MDVSDSSRSRDKPCCLACRQRRIKCNRGDPCSNCSRKGVQCIVPKPKSAPTRKESKDVLGRLERLEEILHFSNDGTEAATTGRTRLINVNNYIKNDTYTDRTSILSSHDIYGNGKVYPKEAVSSRPSERGSGMVHSKGSCKASTTSQLNSRNESKYIGSSLFRELLQEVPETRETAVHSSSLDEKFTIPGDNLTMATTQGSPCSSHESILGFNSTMSSLTDLHPPSSQILGYWALYKQKVDPIVRVLHKPTVETLFVSASKTPYRIPLSVEPILFAVYLAVTISLEPDECQSILKVDRESAIKRYRFATQQALTRANFLTPKDTNVVAAFIILLTCMRCLITAGEAWMLVGLLIRIAHSLELHKDGSHLGLSLYETEIRRRIWWQVCHLDLCISEDHGVEPTIVDSSFDTLLPTNLEDSDLGPEMSDLPAAREGLTQMMFDLVRYEIETTIRSVIRNLRSTKGSHSSEETARLDQIILKSNEAALEALRLRLENGYFEYCNMDSPLHRITIIVSKMMLAKVQLMVHLPQSRQSLDSEHTGNSQRLVFRALIDIIRYARLLETQQRIIQFAWIFKICSQWSAFSLLLAKLGTGVAYPGIEDAWIVIDEAWKAWSSQKSVPKLIPGLMQQAQAQRSKTSEQTRKSSLKSDTFQPNLTGRIATRDPNGPDSSSPNPSVSMRSSNTPGSMNSTPSDTNYGATAPLYSTNFRDTLDTILQDKHSNPTAIPIDISNAWATIANQHSDIPSSMLVLDDIVMDDDLM